MKYLIDTHILLWAIKDEMKLSSSVQKILLDARNDIFVSSVSLWEISIKYNLDKLDISPKTPADIETACTLLNFKLIPLTSDVCSSFYKLPKEDHKDPFDRMLTWQAIKGEMPLITADSSFTNYLKMGLKIVK